MKNQIANSEIKHSINAPDQMALNLIHLHKIRAMISGDPSLARSAFGRLKIGQKKLLLMASGLSQYLIDWNHLSDWQIKKIQIGIRRLKLIINEFSACEDSDFQISPQAKQTRIEKLNESRAELFAVIERNNQLIKGPCNATRNKTDDNTRW